MPDSKKSEKFKMERIAVYDKLMGILNYSQNQYFILNDLDTNIDHLLSIGDEDNSSDNCIACKNSKKSHPSCNWTFEKCADTFQNVISGVPVRKTSCAP